MINTPTFVKFRDEQEQVLLLKAGAPIPPKHSRFFMDKHCYTVQDVQYAYLTEDERGRSYGVNLIGPCFLVTVTMKQEW